jgi:hypothetical protein
MKTTNHLDTLSYKTDPNEGYRLSFANSAPDTINIIITPKGIKYEPLSREGV